MCNASLAKVDLVTKVLPQLHVTDTSLYEGWMFCFTTVTFQKNMGWIIPETIYLCKLKMIFMAKITEPKA
mgnify:CR=1 FL=1